MLKSINVKKLLSIALACVMMVVVSITGLSSVTYAKAEDGTSRIFKKASSSEIVQQLQILPSSKEYSDSLQYGISYTQSNKSFNSKYKFLENKLKNIEPIYSNSTNQFYSYDTSVYETFNIQNISKIIAIEKILDYYSIMYETINDEMVLIEYLPDGSTNIYVRSIDIKTFETNQNMIVTAYLGDESIVKELSFVTKDSNVKSTSKKIEFSTPVDCGFEDTGINGVVEETKDVFIGYLNTYTSARVVRYISLYRKQTDGWVAYAIGASVSVIALYYGWSAVAVANLLGSFSVLITVTDGIQKLAKSIAIQKYPNYLSNDGKFGDIYYTTLYNQYCRAYSDYGTSKYTGGLLSNGSFNYTKQGYTGIETNNYVFVFSTFTYNRVLNEFNTVSGLRPV